jgi:hypothetical protein
MGSGNPVRKVYVAMVLDSWRIAFTKQLCKQTSWHLRTQTKFCLRSVDRDLYATEDWERVTTEDVEQARLAAKNGSGRMIVPPIEPIIFQGIDRRQA